MKTTATAVVAASGLLVLGAALGGCSSSSSSSAPTTGAASPSASPTSASPTPTPTEAPTTPAPASLAPPAGAKELAHSDKDGVAYTHYSIEETPKAVIEHYKAEAKKDGYTILESGGGGGGWGKYGGSSYGMEAERTGTYINVQAGGEKGRTSFFEVCVGASKQAVSQCQQHSQNQN